jgi:predicted AlkP superfamily pyrophosphatase or phosphodiesterase
MTPGEHGIVGHQVFDRDYDERINLLTGWNERTDPKVWQPHQTVSELAASLGTFCYAIGPDEYRHSGYTKATMRAAIYQNAESIADRFEVAKSNISGPGESISYLYIPELDKFGHRFGWQSPGWAMLLEDLDARLSAFAKGLPKDGALIVTADHGMIDSAEDNRIYIDDYVEQGGFLEWFGGDTRAAYLYLKDSSATEEMIAGLDGYSSLFSAIDTRHAVGANWFGPIGLEAEARLPEVILLAKSTLTLFHSVYSKKRSIEMIAHHGGLSSQELRIPLIRIGI